MRFLVFSDLHGNQYAWRAFQRAFPDIAYDRLVFLGDIFGYYYGQCELLDALSKRTDLIWLRGNHDEFFLKLLRGEMECSRLVERYGSTYATAPELRWAEHLIREKPFCMEWEADGRRILFCHGTPADPEAGRLYPKDPWSPELCGDHDVVICGHTHFRMVRKGGGRLWLNVGSLGQPRDGNSSGALTFDTETGDYTYLDFHYDKRPLYREILDRDPEQEKLSEILRREKETTDGR